MPPPFRMEKGEIEKVKMMPPLLCIYSVHISYYYYYNSCLLGCCIAKCQIPFHLKCGSPLQMLKPQMSLGLYWFLGFMWYMKF